MGIRRARLVAVGILPLAVTLLGTALAPAGGEQLDDLFQTWLFTAGRPVLEGAAAAAHAKAAPARSAAARTQLRQAERLRR